MGDKSRQMILGETGIFHKMWKGHNGEHVLETNGEKKAYLQSLCLKKTDEISKHVKWFSYCIMDNHPHETGQAGWDVTIKESRKKGIKMFGNWMRNAHSKFGKFYNSSHVRYGKVASARPLTTQLRSEKDVLNTMLYIDANPVRARIVSHPSKYVWSSYNVYAYGKKTEFSKYLDVPEAYLALGKTPKKRQRAYRSLMLHYLRERGLLNDIPPDDNAIDLSSYISIFDCIEELMRRASRKIREKPG
jgi:putative transposase